MPTHAQAPRILFESQGHAMFLSVGADTFWFRDFLGNTVASTIRTATRGKIFIQGESEMREPIRL